MPAAEQEIGFLATMLTLLFAAVIVFVYFLFVFFQKKLLQKQKESFHAILAAQEKEKERIAKDLHDQAGPLLSKLKINMDLLSDQPDQQEWHLFKQDNSELIDTLVTDIRSTSYDLMPRVLITKGLMIAMEDFCEMMARGLGTTIIFSKHGEAPVLNQQHELNLYRVVQEIVNNAIKYAQAKEIAVSATINETELVLEVSDNGSGFDYENALKNNTKSLGLKNIRSRIDLLNGKLDVTSTPGKGTTYLMRFRLNNLKQQTDAG